MLPSEELLQSIDIIAQNAAKNGVKIYTATVTAVGDNNTCSVRVNGKTHSNITYYGDAPTVNKSYRVFCPNGSMNQAFIITGGGSSGGSAYTLPIASADVLGGIKVGAGLTISTEGTLSATGGGTADAVEWKNVLDKPTTIAGYGITDAKIDGNNVVLGNKTITPYSANNPPAYPVTSVNGQTGNVVIPTGGNVDSVNGKTGVVVLNAADVGALPNTTVIPDKTSQLDNDSGYITNSALTDYAKKTEIPTKTSELTNDSGFITEDDLTKATDEQLGTIKTNTAKGIKLNNDGQLEIAGLLGVTNDGGLFAPSSITPKNVLAGSLLVTDASGTQLGKKSLSVTTGMTITLLGSHPAGSTSYRVTNNYANRIMLAAFVGGRACLNENSAKDGTVAITSITIDGSEYTPGSESTSTSPIIIALESSINPNASTASIRLYPSQAGFSNLLFGIAGVPNNSSGYSLVGGQPALNRSNASAVIGNKLYNTGNSSLLSGREHINTKQNAFLAGQGHDTTNGADSVAAVGRFADIKGTTRFAVGIGSSPTNRKNAFEVNADGTATLAKAPVNDMDVATKGYVIQAIKDYIAALGLYRSP